MTARLVNNVIRISTVAASLGRRVVSHQATHWLHVLARWRAVTITTFLAVKIKPKLITPIRRVAKNWNHVLQHDASSAAGLQQRIVDEFSWTTAGSEVDMGFMFTVRPGYIRTASPAPSSPPPWPSVRSFPSSSSVTWGEGKNTLSNDICE